MPFSHIKRVSRRLARRTKSWGTIVALTMRGNRIEKKSNLKRSKNPVLLLYGFGATRRTFSILERRLYNAGYTVFSINLGGIFGTFNTHAIEQLASKVDQKIEHLYKKYQFRGKISVIAHSKGGLIGRYYIKRLGGDERTRMLITLGTPHNGNPWALFASFTPVSLILKSVRQMTPMSPFIKRLQQGTFPAKVKFYSIYSKDDRVCPFPCGVLKETSNVKNIEVDGISHSEFLIKKSVFHIITHALDNNMPSSLTTRTQERIDLHNKNQKNKAGLRLIEGARNLKLGKSS